MLGFTAAEDITSGDELRWCTITHLTQPELVLHLSTPGKPLSVEALMRDTSGSRLVLVETQEFNPPDLDRSDV